MQEFLEKYPQIKPYLLPFSIGGIGLLLIIIGIVISFTSHQDEKIDFKNTESIDAVGNGLKPFPTDAIKQIIVAVSGAVIKDGIYNLDVNSRVQDALKAAGGLSENADREFVEKRINMAAKLVDGAKIYIPRKGETVIVSSTDQSSTGVVDQAATININEATLDKLDTLPGIGQVTAQKIIAGRPYSEVQDLLNKKIVSNSVFGKIKDKITAY